MSKFIIEVPVDAQYIMINGVRMGDCYTQTTYIADIEELNSDYINEHFGDLQDTAYQQGLEEGKAIHEKGCEGCKYAGSLQGSSSCFNCSNYYKSNWTATDDKIEVGDEVTNKSDFVGWTAVCIQIDADGRHMNLMGHTGAVAYYPVENFKKTGRHFDIASILEEMKE